jgi:hypothetical protein
MPRQLKVGLSIDVSHSISPGTGSFTRSKFDFNETGLIVK